MDGMTVIVQYFPPGWDARPSQGYPQHLGQVSLMVCWFSFIMWSKVFVSQDILSGLTNDSQFSFVHLGGEKQCEVKNLV